MVRSNGVRVKTYTKRQQRMDRTVHNSPLHQFEPDCKRPHSIRLYTDSVLKVRTKGLNISQICSDAVDAAAGMVRCGTCHTKFKEKS